MDNLSGYRPIPMSGLNPLPCRANGPKLTEGKTTTTLYGLTCVALGGTDLELW